MSNWGHLCASLLGTIVGYLPLQELFKLRTISSHWYNIKPFYSKIITSQITKIQTKILFQHITKRIVNKIDMRSSEIITTWADFTNLHHLNVSGTVQISTIISQLRKHKTLSTLILSNCRITNQDLEHVATISNLSHLDISKSYSNKIKYGLGLGLIHLTSLSNLKKLYITDVVLSDDDVHIISTFRNIQTISLTMCTVRTIYDYKKPPCISNKGLSHLINLINLTELVLNGCYDMTEEGITNLSLCPCLKNVNLSEYDSSSNHISKFLNLETLKLKYYITHSAMYHQVTFEEMINLLELDIESFNNDGPINSQLYHISKITNLRKLRLFNTPEKMMSRFNVSIRSEGIQHLTNLKNLVELSLVCHGISDDVLCHFSDFNDFNDLKKLSLFCCYSVSAKGLQYLTKLTHLQNLTIMFWNGASNREHERVRYLIAHDKDNLKLELKYEWHGDTENNHISLIRIKKAGILNVFGVGISALYMKLVNALMSVPSESYESIKLTIKSPIFTNYALLKLKIKNEERLSCINLINCHVIEQKQQDFIKIKNKIKTKTKTVMHTYTYYCCHDIFQNICVGCDELCYS